MGRSAAIEDELGACIGWAELAEQVSAYPTSGSLVRLTAEPTIAFVIALLANLTGDRAIHLVRPGDLDDKGRDEGDAITLPLAISEAKAEAEGGVLLVFRTSGTTGQPKWVGITRTQLDLSIEGLQHCLPKQEGDSALICLPLWHVHGLVCLLRCLREGTPVKLARFNPRLIIDHTITWISLVPTMLRLLLREQGDAALGRLRYVRLASAPMGAMEQAQLQSRLGLPIYQHYGMTEAAHFVMGQGPGQPNTPGSVGRVQDDRLAIRITAEGEILLRGQNIITRYLNTVEGFTADGFLRTGDLGELVNGELFIRGRLGDLINRAGEKINPLDLEARVQGMLPGADLVVAVGIPDPLYGQLVGLIIQSSVSIDTNALMDELKKPLRPDCILVTKEALPTGPTGKILRRQLALLFKM